MYTVLLPPGDNHIAVNKYIYIYLSKMLSFGTYDFNAYNKWLFVCKENAS